MTLQPLVQAAVAQDLSVLTPRHAGGNHALWERRTLNIHRGIVLLERPGDVDAEALLGEVRQTVASEFNLTWAWLRGFAFGAVVSTAKVPANVERLAKCVDRYNQLRGVWQWMVFVNQDPPVAFGVHMWAEGYLSPTFRRLVSGLQASGRECPAFTDDKGPFFSFLANIRRLPARDFRRDT